MHTLHQTIKCKGLNVCIVSMYPVCILVSSSYWYKPGRGGWYFIKFSLARFSMQQQNWTQSDLRFCENEGSKRFKINEKEAQLAKDFTKCLKSVK